MISLLIQVLLIRSIVTAGIRAALRCFWISRGEVDRDEGFTLDDEAVSEAAGGSVPFSVTGMRNVSVAKWRGLA